MTGALVSARVVFVDGTGRLTRDGLKILSQISAAAGVVSPVTVTADFTVSATDAYIISSRAATNTGSLPDAVSFPGRSLTIKTTTAQTVVSASSNVVPLIGGAAGTAILAATAGKWARLVSDSTNWIIMESN